MELPGGLRRTPKIALIHQAVVRELANRRAGTADTKTRAQVSGGGRKPWRQKGTGRARHGSIRSPIWRKGGVVFGPHPRSHAIAMNKQSRRAALAMALAVKADAGELAVIDPAAVNVDKTKDVRALLSAGGEAVAPGRVLLIIHCADDQDSGRRLARAGKNLRNLGVVGHDEVTVHKLMAADRVLVSKNALSALGKVSHG